jgi:hypothetical protein
MKMRLLHPQPCEGGSLGGGGGWGYPSGSPASLKAERSRMQLMDCLTSKQGRLNRLKMHSDYVKQLVII